MNIQFSTLFFICIGCMIPLLVLSTSKQHLHEDVSDDFNNEHDRFAKSTYNQRNQYRPALYNDHYLRKKGADFEQILRPCNQMPASGRGHEYSDCVRSRMLLMGKRKRRDTS